MNIHFIMIPPVRASFLYPSEDIRILYAAFFSKLCLVSHDNSLITFFFFLLRHIFDAHLTAIHHRYFDRKKTKYALC